MQARTASQAVRQLVAVERWTCMDEAGIHRAMTRLCGRAPRGHVSLRPSRSTTAQNAPNLSPIVPGWSQVKTALRQAKAHTREARDRAVAHVLTTITAAEAQHGGAHCGEAVP